MKKRNPYSFCTDFDFKKFKTIDKEELSNFIKGLNYI